jgi:hypothetical protein
MEEMHFHQLYAPSLPVIMAAAEGFGLTSDEVWQAAADALETSGGDAHAPGYRDELVAVLALRILAKERRVIAAERGIRLPDEPAPPEAEGPGSR